jgi:hypothetical protein
MSENPTSSSRLANRIPLCRLTVIPVASFHAHTSA